MASIAGELLGSLPVLADTPPRKKDGVAKKFDVHGAGRRTSMSKGMASPQDNIEDRPKKARKTRAPRDPDADVSGEVCKNYLAGRCKFGDECKYEHSEGEPIEPPPRGQCFNFRDGGECQFGDRCRYLHGEDDDRFARRAAERSAGRENQRGVHRGRNTGCTVRL